MALKRDLLFFVISDSARKPLQAGNYTRRYLSFLARRSGKSNTTQQIALGPYVSPVSKLADPLHSGIY